MVAFTLGLPAGYFGGRFDAALSFIANLILAFPVILLFYLLVTPEIRASGIPMFAAGLLFLFPIIFAVLLLWSRFDTQRAKLAAYLAIALLLGLWAYSGLAFNADPLGVFAMDANLLNIFVSVVFVNAPAVFRIVRGLTIDIRTRDYVAAAQTRGENPWYIMLWEILPNARGPLIVDFCLRIGYTTILLGTLGFFGLGVSPESPGLGHDHQRGPQAAGDLSALRAGAGPGADVAGARPQHARRRPARAVAEGLGHDRRDAHPRDRESQHLLLHQQGRDPGGDGLLLPHHAGRGDGPGRRIRLRQVDRRAGGDALPGPERAASPRARSASRAATWRR